MVDVTVAISIIGITAILGYIGNVIFERTRIPDILWLLIFGMVIAWLGFVPGSSIMAFVPLLAAVAIVMLSFESGLYTNLLHLIKEFPRTFLLASVSVFLSAFAVALVGLFVMKLNLIMALMFGFILSSVSSTITVRSFVEALKVRKDVKFYLEYESILSDMLAIIFTIFLINIAIANTGYAPLYSILGPFAIGASVGLVIGLVWLILLNRVKGKSFDYILTLGFAFVVFSVAEFFASGAGVIAPIFYGLILGNGKRLSGFLKLIHLEKEYSISPFLKKFHSEISFLLRAFFFVLLGIVSVSLIGLEFVLQGTLIAIVIVLIRIPAVKVSMLKKELTKNEMNIIRAMIPRDLAPIVLLQIAIAAGVKEMSPLMGVIFVVIFATVLYTTIMTVILNRDKPLKKNRSLPDLDTTHIPVKGNE